MQHVHLISTLYFAIICNEGGDHLALSEARKAANIRWDKEHLARMSLALPSELRDQMKDHITTTGESMNAFIKRAIAETIKNDVQARPRGDILNQVPPPK